MGTNSGRTSGSFARGIFKRAQKQEPAQRSVEPDAKQGFTIDSAPSREPVQENRTKTTENVSSAGVRNLNKEGFIIYNLPEANEIFVSSPSESAFMDEDEPYLIRASTEEFPEAVESMPVLNVVRPQAREVVVSQPSDIFANALAKEDLGDIDYTEVIVKKSTGVREEILYDAGYTAENVSEAKSANVAMTCADAAPITAFREPVAFKEIVEFKEEAPAKVEVVEVEGLYTENRAPINVARAGLRVRTAFEGTVIRARAVTESAAVKAPMMSLPATFAAPVKVQETTKTVSEVFHVSDPVADILRFTVPELNEDEKTLAEMPLDRGSHIPEDGLESYDAKFKIRRPALAMEFAAPAKLRTLGTSLNFTF